MNQFRLKVAGLSVAAAATGLLLFFQNCGGALQSARDLASIDGNNSGSSIDLSKIDPAPRIYGVLSTPAQNRPAINVQNYAFGDTIVSENFVKGLKANTNSSRGSQKALSSSSGVALWGSGRIPLYFDINSNFTAAQLSTLKANIFEICGRWSNVANIICVEETNPSPSSVFLTITQAGVSLSWVENYGSLCQKPQGHPNAFLSCSSLGFLGTNGLSYLAVNPQHISNMGVLSSLFARVLGLAHEHQRPGRDQAILFRADINRSRADFMIFSSLQQVMNNYDYGSVTHYPIVESRNQNFLNNTGESALAFSSGSTMDLQYAQHRSALVYPAGSAGASVNLAGYPSIQDATNAVALYGDPRVARSSCSLYNGQVVMPHGTRIGVYTTQAAGQSGYCDDEPRVCLNGTLLGGNGTQGYRTCPLRCSIGGKNYAYGEQAVYYTRQSGTQAECNSARLTMYCDFTRMSASGAVSGFQSCSVASPGPNPGPNPQPGPNPGGAVNCVGSWGGCMPDCGSNRYQTFTITTQATNGGTACEAASGQTRACSASQTACGTDPVNCAGSWGQCPSCGDNVNQTYTITRPAQNGGSLCEATNGQQRLCSIPTCLFKWDRAPSGNESSPIQIAVESANVHESLKVSGGKAPYIYDVTSYSSSQGGGVIPFVTFVSSPTAATPSQPFTMNSTNGETYMRLQSPMIINYPAVSASVNVGLFTVTVWDSSSPRQEIKHIFKYVISDSLAELSCEIEAGSRLSSLTMRGKIIPKFSDVDKNGYFYLARKSALDGNKWYAHNGTDWVYVPDTADENGFPPLGGDAFNKLIKSGLAGRFLENYNASAIPDVEIYIGYGRGDTKKAAWADMLSAAPTIGSPGNKLLKCSSVSGLSP